MHLLFVLLVGLLSMFYGSAWAEEMSLERHTWFITALQQVDESDENDTIPNEAFNIHPELQEQIQQSLSGCRYKDSSLESYTPNFFQTSFCEEVLSEALQSGVPLGWLKHFVNSFSVAEETEKRTVYVY